MSRKVRGHGRLRGTTIAASAIAALVASSALLVSAGREDPAEVPTPAEVNARVMSPFCPGLSLEECPSEQAAELRAEIREQIDAGATNREIDRWLVGNYGESILGRPRQALSWIVPSAFLVAGLAAVSYLVTRRSRTRAKDETADPILEQSAAESPHRAQMLEDLAVLAKSTE